MITPNGRAAGLRVVEANAHPSAYKELLVHDALANVEAWRFEEAHEKNTMHLTYSYELISPAGAGSHAPVEFLLPNQVVVRESRIH
jgi:hypothetical protein